VTDPDILKDIDNDDVNYGDTYLGAIIKLEDNLEVINILW